MLLKNVNWIASVVTKFPDFCIFNGKKDFNLRVMPTYSQIIDFFISWIFSIEQKPVNR